MTRNGFANARQFGKYAVQRRLGSGANSVIFEVLDTQSGRTYALKRIVKRSHSDEKFFLQADNELQTAQKIDHAVIRKIHELLRVRSFFRVREIHLLMEMFYGQTIESHQPTDIKDIVAIFRQAAAGLEAMHAAGFAHADIKPNNILVGPDGAVKIIDLGQSCPLGTIKARIQGTPDYIAPEQVHRRPIDQRTDVYNLGATLYWTLTGHHVPTVLPRAQPGREIAIITSNPAVHPHDLNPNIPPALSRLVMECVNLSPAERPEDMKTFGTRLEMIELILMKEAGQLPPVTPGEHDWELNGASSDDDTVDFSAFGLD